MSRITALCAGLLLLAMAGAAAAAQGASIISDRGAPLVRELEARYGQSMQAARRGDLEGYWRLRTAASRTRPPALDSARLRLLADLLPPLQSLIFVRLDTTDKMARALYRWRKEDVAQYSVIVYRMEQGEWKLDDFSVRRASVAAAVPGAARQAVPLPRVNAAHSTAPPPPAAMDPDALDLLKGWDSKESPAARSLGAPRL